MRHRQTKRARQYALPGCCFDKPIVVDDDDEQTTATKPRNIPISAHTATWLEAKARGRWSASATTTAESTSSNTVTRVEEEAEDGWRGSVSRPAVQAEKSQRCRKRTFADVGDDGDEVNGDAKRLRLPGTGMAEREKRPNQNILHTNAGLVHPNQRCRLTDHSHVTNNSRLINQSYLTNHSRLTNSTDENPARDVAELEAGLRTMLWKMDLERATVRDIQRAEEQARIQEDEKQAREAEIRRRSYRPTVHSSLQEMWKDCDRDRKAAEERRDAREREEREEAKRRESEAETAKLNELSNIEASLKSMWEAHDIARGLPGRIRPGQLSERGQARAREWRRS